MTEVIKKNREMIIRNIQKCKTPDTIHTLRDMIWDRMDGDRHLLNLVTARESSLFGMLTNQQWQDIMSYKLAKGEWMADNPYSDYAIFVKDPGNKTLLYHKMTAIYNEANGY